MSLSRSWAEAKGMVWPSSAAVRRGAEIAGLHAMMVRFPTMRESLRGVLDSGVMAYITATIVAFNFGEGGGGEAFVEGWNDYVSEYQKCMQNRADAGQFNSTGGRGAGHAGCLIHAERFVNFKWQWRDWGSRQKPPPPREETWGYASALAPSTIALAAVKGAAVRGSGAVVSRADRRIALPALSGAGLLSDPNGDPVVAWEPEAQPWQVGPQPGELPEQKISWAWIAIPAALFLLSR